MSSRKNPNESLSKKTMKILKEDFLRWICEKQASNSPLDMTILGEKAVAIAKNLGSNDFKCTKAWLSAFLRKHGFPSTMNYPNPIFANYRLWIDLMRPTITQYKHKNLFHADELTMYTDVTPESVCPHAGVKQESNDGRNRVTVLMCCNSTGTEKIPLLISGTYSSSTMKDDHFYHHRENAWIDENLFRDWIVQLNDQMASNDRKVLLLLHRKWTRALENLHLSNVNLVYFPNDFPPLLRPLKRDVFHYIKMMYRRKYAKKAATSSGNVDWNVNEVLNTLIDAWKNVPQELIVSSFQRTSFRTDDCFLRIACDDWEDLHKGMWMSFRKFVTFDDNLSDEQYQQSQASKRRHHYNLRTHLDVIQLNDDAESFVDFERVHTSKKVRNRTRLLKEDKDSSMLKGNRSIDDDRSQAESRRKSTKRTHSQAEIVSFSSSDHITEDLNSMPKDLSEVIHINAESARERVMDLPGVKTVMDDLITAVAITEDDTLHQPSTARVEHEYVKRLLERIYDRSETQTRKDDDGHSVIDSSAPTEQASPRDNERCGSLSLKRKRSSDAGDNDIAEMAEDGKPLEKRLKPDPDWYKRYETHYAFGSSDACGSTSIQSPNLQFGTNEICQALTSKSKRTQIKAGDSEKRCIFTISRRSTSPQLSPRN